MASLSKIQTFCELNRSKNIGSIQFAKIFCQGTSKRVPLEWSRETVSKIAEIGDLNMMFTKNHLKRPSSHPD